MIKVLVKFDLSSRKASEEKWELVSAFPQTNLLTFFVYSLLIG